MVIKTNKCEEVSAVQQEATHVVGVIGTKTRYEQQALYYLCGWVAHKLNVSTCSECSQSLSDSTPTLPQADFTVLKSYGGLIHPSKQLVDVLTKAEDVFMASDKKSASVEALVAQLLSTSLFLDSCSVQPFFCCYLILDSPVIISIVFWIWIIVARSRRLSQLEPGNKYNWEL